MSVYHFWDVMMKKFTESTNEEGLLRLDLHEEHIGSKMQSLFLDNILVNV